MKEFVLRADSKKDYSWRFATIRKYEPGDMVGSGWGKGWGKEEVTKYTFEILLSGYNRPLSKKEVRVLASKLLELTRK